MGDGPNSNSRRNFLKSRRIAISSVALPGQVAVAAIGTGKTKDAQGAAVQAEPRFLEEPERGFLEAAVNRLIPPDERWPGAVEAGVLNYIDLQMAGDWGKGNLIYRHGPFGPISHYGRSSLMDQEKALPAILPGTDAKKRRRGIVVHSRWMW